MKMFISKKKAMKMFGFSSKKNKITHVKDDDVHHASDHDLSQKEKSDLHSTSVSVVELLVKMKSEKCEKKIRKVISELKGVDKLEIDIEKQKVTVTGHVKQKKVLKLVRKTGRKAEYWPFTYVDTTAAVVGQHQGSSSSSSSSSDDESDNDSDYTPSYNYYTHRYNQRMHGYYIDPRYLVADDHITYTFNDENVHACIIM